MKLSLGIGKKIWLGIGALLLGYTFSMVFGFVRGRETESRLSEVSEAWFPATRMSQTAVTSFNEQIKFYSDAVMLGEGEYIEKASFKGQDTLESLQGITVLSGIRQENLDNITAILTQLQAFTEMAEPVYGQMSGAEAYAEVETPETIEGADPIAYLAEQTAILKEGLKTVNQGLENSLKQELADTSSATRQQRIMNAILFCVVLGVSLVFVTLIVRSITGPVNTAVGVLKDIAQGEGDLTKRLKVNSQDEIGEMARWFNLFVEKLEGIISQISQNAITLSHASQQMSVTAGDMVNEAQQMNRQSDQVNTASDEMAGQMNDMAQSSQQMSSNIQTVASAVEQMTASIEEIARNAEQAAHVADQAAKLAQDSNANISQLGEAADEIGKVITVIQDIAEQTNLLALNATIEAARAGDAGKGFAVVASEVKDLARQTGTATEGIVERINAIQASTNQTVESIGQISQVIQQVNDVSRTIATAVEEQSITTKEIANNVAQTADASERVSNGVNDSAASTQVIAQNIAQVSKAAQHASQGAGNTQTASQELSKMAEELQTLMRQFKVSTP